MRPAQPPSARRSGRPPLRELRLQAGAERTCLTPLLRRLRLKDHDGTSPGPCTPGPPGSSIRRPCTPGPPSSARPEPCTPGTPCRTRLEPCTPGPPSSARPEPCPPGPPSSARPELCPPGTPHSAPLEPCTLGTPRSTRPEPCTPGPPSSARPEPCILGTSHSAAPEPCTLGTPRSGSLERCIPGTPCSTSPDQCIPGTPRNVPVEQCIPGSPCSPAVEQSPPGALSRTPPEPGTPEPPGNTSPIEPPPGSATPELCSPEPPSSVTAEPAGSATPEPPCSVTAEPPCSATPEPHCSATPEPAGSATPEPPSSVSPAGSCTHEPPESPSEPCTLEPPSPTTVGPCTQDPPGSATMDPPGSATKEPPSSTTVGSCTQDPPGSATMDPPGSATKERPSSAAMGPCTQDPPGSATTEPPSSPSLGPCTPRPRGSTPLASPSSATPASCTPGPPGTSSTPQETPFCGWRVVPADLSCSPVAPADPSGDGDSAPPPGEGTSGGPTSPSLAPREQEHPGPSPSKATGSEPAGPEAAATPAPSSEPAAGAVSWAMPLVWLEKSLNASSLLESLRHSLPLPAPRRDAGTSVTPVPTAAAGTSVTPVPTAAAGTSTTPRALLERGTNTCAPGPARAKDSAAETDSLLWHCPREQLKSLPRAELEGRLESTLIIIEALSLQLRDWQESQRLLPAAGPAEQRDALTQTDVTRPQGEEEIYHGLYVELRRRMEALQRQQAVEQDLKRELERAAAGTSAWAEQCLLVRGLMDAAFQNLQDDRAALAREREQLMSLVSWCGAVLQTVPDKLRGCLRERDALRQRADEALRAKEEGDRFLEAFCSHASSEIGAREQSLDSQRELGALLAQAIDQQASLAAESRPFREFIDVAFENLREERRALDEEREQARCLVSRCQAMLQSVPGKLQSCLQERDATRQRAEEALQAKEEASRQLQETAVALQDSVAQVEQLAVANARLSEDLSSRMKELAALQQERDALQQDNEDYQEQTARLAKERDVLRRERDGLSRELREMTECREFIDQENRMSRTQLLEAEAKLKSVRAALQERDRQHEELQDLHQCLQEKRAALHKELESTKAELQDLQLRRVRVSQCSVDIAESKLRLQDLADCLRAALQEEADSSPARSRARPPAPRTPGWRTPGPWQTPRRARTPVCRTPACRTPYRAGDSFVGSVLKAASGKDADEASSTFTRLGPASTPKQTEPEDGLMESARELRGAVSDLAVLNCRVQELEQSKFRELQAEISNLQLRLEEVTAESQEKTDMQAATIARLNKALQGKLQNEKELQDVVKQQEEKMLQLIDKSGEVTRLKGEVSQLKRSLQRAETEAKVLWEELRGQEPKADAASVQERVLLRQEVDKLRLLLLEKEEESSRLSSKHLEQLRALEQRLCHVHKELRSHEEMKEKMREVLSSVPAAAAGGQELHSLLRYLGLLPAGGGRDTADPL